jgi:shikimate dehydrogenase
VRLLALLGDPVAHSLSPLLQNAAFREADVEGTYLALRVGSQDLEGLLKGIARAGGGGNVTLPHKERAAEVVERRLPAADRTGACNTFWLEEGRIVGDNTDVEGFRQALRLLLGREAMGLRVLLLGAGGAARAVLHALVEDGGEAIWIRNRSPGRARELAATLGGGRARVWDGAASAPGEVDLVVNATRLGMGPRDPLPLSPGELPPGEPACMDLVYRPDETAWVREMRALGLAAEDGGEMLVQQGAAAFARWWGRPAPLEVMRRALAGARAHVGDGERRQG